jgi:hypothetical protein
MTELGGTETFPARPQRLMKPASPMCPGINVLYRSILEAVWSGRSTKPGRDQEPLIAASAKTSDE